MNMEFRLKEPYQPFYDSFLLPPLMKMNADDFIFSGVYFLYDGEMLQYIGQSVNVLARISDHRRMDKFVFNYFGVLRCEPDMLRPLEAGCITRFKPKINSQRAGSMSKARFEMLQYFEEVPVPSDLPPEVAPRARRLELSTLDGAGLVTANEVAQTLRVSLRTLERWRSSGDGPKYQKLGPRKIGYRVSDVREFAGGRR